MVTEVLDAPEVIEEEPSLRDTLTEAFDDAAPEVGTAPTAPAAEPAPAEAEIAPASVEAAPDAGKVVDPNAPVPAAVPAAHAVPVELKAPAQWKPAVREKWNSLPREVQEEVVRREADSMRLIGSVGPKIRMADEVQGHLAPFMPKLQEQGIPPSAFIGDLFASVKSLASPNGTERAEVVANIVQAYGVDLKLLDQVLTQRIQAGPQDAAARRAIAQANAVIQQQRQGVAHQTELETQKALAAFAADPKHEFLDNVRDLMADLIEAGRAKNLEDAYAAAIWAHPDTRKILLQREATTRAADKTIRARQARRASSAIHGAPQSTGTPVPQNASLRDTIAAALDEHSSL